jgi:hypothetical protein
MPSVASQLRNLYRNPVESKRTGPLFNAFSYPTKIDPEAVAVFLATHTRPGAHVLDPFGGSGSTGIAACLCDRPTERMRSIAKAAGVSPTWGPRIAHVYELSPIGALVARVMTNPPPRKDFEAAASRMLEDALASFGDYYDALSPDGKPGELRYIVWSEVLETPCCRHQVSLWDATASLNPAKLASTFKCPECARSVQVEECDRVTSTVADPFTGAPIEQRLRWMARVYGRSSRKTWSRAPTSADHEAAQLAEQTPLPPSAPDVALSLGDLYRSGYHTGISHLHHLYTPRNFRAVAHLWASIPERDPRLADALKLLVLSYNASHSTLMTRIVAKRSQKDFVVTGAQSGVMYVSGLPVEKNVFDGVRRKVRTFANAFAMTYGSQSNVNVVNASSTALTTLAAASIDYVFTDPPFGDFIPYAEVNQVNEAWLGMLTDRADEAIVSPAQGKGVAEYGRLLGQVFSETARVLRPDGHATVVFHASKPAVWEALGDALRRSGFAVELTSVLDKSQVSFKQVVHDGGTRGDAVFLLRRDSSSASAATDSSASLEHAIEQLEESARGRSEEMEPRRMYSRYVATCVERGVPVAVTAPEFYSRLSERRKQESTT